MARKTWSAEAVLARIARRTDGLYVVVDGNTASNACDAAVRSAISLVIAL